MPLLLIGVVMSSDVEICNMALTRLGQSRIASLSQSGLEAEMCTLYYAQTRDELLSSYEWPFAMERKVLAAEAGTNLTEYDYKYTLPTDLLRPITQISEDDYSDLTDDFRIEGQFLYSDLSPNYLKYIKKVTKASELSVLFVEPFYLRMATKMCLKLTQDQSLLTILFREYSAAMLNAMGVQGSSDRQRPADDTLWSE